MATKFKTVEELGEIKTYKARLSSPILAVVSEVGIVFCQSAEEGIERTIYWDFSKRATLAEVHEYHQKKKALAEV
jgi:hypothetical protein